MKMYCGFAR